ncbi:phosphonoacetaldehyde hydrolase [Mesorhizobium sp. BAC0120]|uniref:phosphonoacetaldehyde hydrolase n=1 Tax=Mesorhizobium sp. BAC0120 TaxID=3090670 RepID=UPI00298CCA3D|nr:phosphonoacetaldehyde hydrolase [Mesorhizobium sp. BAC0120]MDW6024079.1 phosphonoacetaldehyde hydrolase [Mesorhizobium sp. BAC0120]
MRARFKAVVFDWAGTMIDFGSFAPMGVFVRTFREFGVDVTIAEARGPMGLPKWHHIRAMLDEPRIAAEWAKVHGAEPTDRDADAIYEVFVPMNEEVVADYATLVPGALDTVLALRARGLKIGSTTGYTRSIMERVMPLAAAQGYRPDCVICADDMRRGRPSPMNMYQCFIELDVWPASAVIKVDDTEPGIAEGVAAGCLTVGVALSGNAVGKTPEQLSALSPADLARLRKGATARLKTAGADHVIDTVADLPDLLERLEQA